MWAELQNKEGTKSAHITLGTTRLFIAVAQLKMDGK